MSRKQREKEILTEKEENSLKEIFNSNNKVFISGILEEEFEYDYGIDTGNFIIIRSGHKDTVKY